MEEFIVSKMALDGVDVTHGRTATEHFLEVRTKGISKGAFLENILLTMKRLGMQMDFVLVLGSDETDESMYEVANQLASSSVSKEDSGGLDKPPVVYTATVGPSQTTTAKLSIASMTEAINLLRGLANISRDINRMRTRAEVYGLDQHEMTQRREGQMRWGSLRQTVSCPSFNTPIISLQSDDTAESMMTESSAVPKTSSVIPVPRQVVTVSFADFLKENESEEDDKIYV